MDLKIDDLLEKVSGLFVIGEEWRVVLRRPFGLQQKDNQAMLDLEYVQLNVPKVLALFNKVRSCVGADNSREGADMGGCGLVVFETKMRLYCGFEGIIGLERDFGL